MSAWARIKGLFSRTPVEPEKVNLDGGPLSARRWEASRTSRLNEAHWARNQAAATVNQDLRGRQQILRRRCNAEAANNPILQGIIETYAAHVVGAKGPTLQITSSSKAYAEWLEGIWNDWWLCPDINGQLSGPEFLRLWVRGLFCDGEYLAQLVVDDMADGPVAARLYALDIERLESHIGDSLEQADGTHVYMGVRRTRTGKPMAYVIRDHIPGIGVRFDRTEVPADDIVHGYERLDASQGRGLPLFASVLPTAADIRDWDSETLDALRVAADFGVIFHTDHANAPYIQVNGEVEFERRVIRSAPPGWKPFQVKAEHGTSDNVGYRRARLREFGRPIGMPLMMIELDSSGHNYSSARFDDGVYGWGIQIRQHRFEHHLDRLLRRIEREARLADNRQGPRDWKSEWTWPKRPNVDPQKEAQAAQVRLEAGTSTICDELAASGTDLETHLDKLEREKSEYEGRGLDYPGAAPEMPEPAPEQPADELDEQVARLLDQPINRLVGW